MLRPRHLRIVLSGAYGMGNLGDEAICRSIMADIEAAHPGARLRVLTFSEQASILAHPAAPRTRFLEFFSIISSFWKIGSWFSIGKGIWEILTCDIIFFGGGGLIRNRTQWLKRYLWPVRIAQWFRKSIVVCCIGVDTLTDPEVIALVQSIRQPLFFSVRDERSKQNLVLAHPKLTGIQVIADPAFHLFKKRSVVRTVTDRAVRIGVNLTSWKADFSNQKQLDAFIQGLATLFDEVAKCGRELHLVYLPTVPHKDATIYQDLQRELKGKYLIEMPTLQTPELFVEHLAHLDFFIGMRLHSLILSSLVQDLPTSMISYDEKTDELRPLFGENFFRISDIIEHPEVAGRRLREALDQGRATVDWTKMRMSSESLVSKILSLLSEG